MITNSALLGRARRLARQINFTLKKRGNYYRLIDPTGSIILGEDSTELSLREAYAILLKA